ncbi:hypothetical protein BJF84_15970 [Rhodococcus sp. CUA-806]|jgi:hypothetical protein|nr:hypothetical protein BJF84_15970 [Rhodococcus sp. CUA-806]
MQQTWANRDLPVLKALVEYMDAGEQLNGATTAEITGLSVDEVQRAIRALDSETPPFLIDVSFDMGGGWDVRGVTGKARRAVGAWPTPDTVADALLARLQEIVDDEDAQPETRDRARAGLKGLASMGRDVLVSVTASAIGAGLLG